MQRSTIGTLILKYRLPNDKELSEPVASIAKAASLAIRSEKFLWGFRDFQVVGAGGDPACTSTEWESAVRSAREAW